MSDMSEGTMGLQLPPYEADFLQWVANTIQQGEDGRYGPHWSGGRVTAEVLIGGEGAVRVTFPSGGQRTIYVDDRPHGGRVTYSLAEVEALRRDLDAAEDRAEDAEEGERAARRVADEVEEELDRALDVIADARALLERLDLPMEGKMAALEQLLDKR